MSVNEQPLADDLLRTIKEIAKFTGHPVRCVQWLCETKAIPAFKVGGRWHARKSALRAHFSA